MRRGQRVPVPPEWLELCRHWREEQRLSLSQIGRQAAEVVGRSRPFGTSTIARYLDGTLITDELTRAFAAMMGVPLPGTAQVLNADEHEWCTLGKRLNELAPVVFQRELSHLRQLMELLDRHK